MSATEETTIDIFGATLTRGKFVKGGGALVVGLSLVGPVVGAKAAKAAAGPRRRVDPTLPSSWLEIHADNTIVMRTGKVELGQGSASTAYAQIAAEELNVPYSAITQRDHGRHRPHARTAASRPATWAPASPNVRKVAALRLPGAAQPGLDAARRAGREPDGQGRRRLGRRQERQLRSARREPAAQPHDPGHRQPAGPVRPHRHGQPADEADQPVQDRRPVDPDADDPADRRGHARPTSATSGCPGMLHARVVHPAGARRRRCVQVGTLDKKQFPNTQIVVKGNLVAVVDPARVQRDRDCLAPRAHDEVDRRGRAFPAAATSSAALRKADWTTTLPCRWGSTSGAPTLRFADRGDEALRDLPVPVREARSDRPDRGGRRRARTDGMVYVHVHSANPQAMRWELAMMLNIVDRQDRRAQLRRLGPLRPLERRQHRRRGRGRDHLADRRQAGPAPVDAVGRHAVVDAASAGVLGRPGRPRRERQARLVQGQPLHAGRCRTTGWSGRCSPGFRR